MCNLCMLWHRYPPTLRKYSNGGKFHSLCESHKPIMNENHPGNLGLKGKRMLLERLQVSMLFNKHRY